MSEGVETKTGDTTQGAVVQEEPVSTKGEGEKRAGESHKTITTVVYGLQVASFLLPITFLVGVVLNYIKKEEVAGTWLESHFRWQIRTFWFALLWSVLGGITTPFVVGVPILIANAIWVIYRIAKGWMRLNDHEEMYA